MKRAVFEATEWLELIALKQRERGIVGLSTGFKVLDDITSGFQPGSLIILGARPAMGKSMLARQFVESACVQSKLPVALFTLGGESRREVTLRMLSSLGRVGPWHHLWYGTLSDQDWDSIGTAAGLLAEAPLEIFDETMDVGQISDAVRQIGSRAGEIGLVVIDNLQLIRFQQLSENEQWDGMRGAVAALKALAKECEVPVLVTSQLTRAPETRRCPRPILSDLRSSGVLEEIADIVMTLYREEYYVVDSNFKGLAEVSVLKNRFGRSGVSTHLRLVSCYYFSDA